MIKACILATLAAENKQIKEVLEGMERVCLAGEWDGEHDLFAAIENCQDTLLIIGTSFPVEKRMLLLEQLKVGYSHLKAVMMAEPFERDFLIRSYTLGVDAVILSSTSKAELEIALKIVVRGGRYVNQHHAQLIWELMATRYQNRIEKPVKLSTLELEIYTLIGLGLTNEEIGKQLGCSKRTVETQRMHLLQKTGTTNTASLVRYGLLHGIIS